MKNLKDFEFKNKKVLVRCDLNVPLSEEGAILDDFRIKAVLPTIKYLIGKKAKIILMSHLGRPDGKIDEKLRLTPVCERMKEYLKQSIVKTSDVVGPEVEETILEMKAGEVVLLENVQFHSGEKENDENFAKTIASYGDIFILEAFGQAHRNYASIAGIQKYLPSATGFLLEKEVTVLKDLLENPKRPLIAIIGGKKVETKSRLINKILEIGDSVLIANLLQDEIKNKDINLKFPQKIVEPVDSLEGKDIGPKTIKLFKEKIKTAKTILWNGPLGMIEREKYSQGSKEIIQAIIESGAFSVVGGGETVEFINKLGLSSKFNHVSTGGGAMIAFLSGEKMPGIEALQ